MIDANESNFIMRNFDDGEFPTRWVLQSENFISGEVYIGWVSIRSVSVRWV